MDERSHNPFPHPPQQPDAHGIAPMAWRHGDAHAAHGAAHSGEPASQQFQYAASGFVLPGATPGHAPMTDDGGTIGVPAHQPVSEGMPAGTAGRAWFASTAAFPHGQPQAWAFPTPHGLELVHPAASSRQHPGAGPGAPAAAAAVQHRRRLRWETIVPGSAVACVVAAAALFISDFDRITGQEVTAGEPVASTAAVGATADAPAGGDASAVVQQAAQLLEAGRFDDAANMLNPLLDQASPDESAVALNDKVHAAAKRNRALLRRLQRQRRAARWPAVITTLEQLEQLRPLAPAHLKLRRQARVAVMRRNAITRATALMAKGRDAEALAVIERALRAGPNKRLEALREQVSARRATPSAGPSGASSGGISGGHAGHARRPAAPAPGGQPSGASNVRPPASVPAGAIPQRPDVPNPASAQGTGASAVGGGGGCHQHDGVVECH